MFHPCFELIKRQRRVVGFCSFLFVATFASDVFAASTSTLGGTISEVRTGKPIIGAQVYIIEKTVKDRAEIRFLEDTDLSGQYQISEIPAGSYTVVVRSPGYKASVEKTFVVHSGEPQKLNLALENL